jgi:hypothetical protein
MSDMSDSIVYGFMVFNATFNNISDISWQSVLLVEETGVPRENHHIRLYSPEWDLNSRQQW